MGKLSHREESVERNYLSIPKLQRLYRLSLVMDKLFHSILKEKTDIILTALPMFCFWSCYRVYVVYALLHLVQVDRFNYKS